MRPTPASHPRRPDALRRAFALGVALALLVVQFALQTHLVEHDLLPGAHQVCEQCVTAKVATPPAAPPAGLLDPVRAVAPTVAPVARDGDRAPLVVRNRAPPSLA